MGGMKPLPMPVRIAAGLVATALEEVQQLPRKIAEFPVTAISQALQGAMRVQQTVTDLAIKGDRALSSLRPVPESPSWARFDEDEEPLPHRTNGIYSAGESNYLPRTPKVTPVRILPDLPADSDRDFGRDFDREFDGDFDRDFNFEDTGRSGLAAFFDDDPEPSEVPVQRGPVESEPESAAATEPGAEAGSVETETGPPGLENYPEWSLPQLRARFRSLKPYQLQALLDWETSHRDRPPYVTMLSNRIASVTEQ
jgi:hypothetical protein